MSIILADLGGTHLRLARASSPGSIEKYKIQDYPSFDSVLQDYAPDITELYLASAITPLQDIIEDKRFGNKSHWRIDLGALHARLKKIALFNDLEAAAYGLGSVREGQVTTLLPATTPQTHFPAPPKLLIGIGTGIGHAYLFEKPGVSPFVQRTHGGHIPAFGITKAQQDIIALLSSKLSTGRDLIMENIVSGTGLLTLQDLIGKQEAVRFFWEFLGLYCNALVTLSASYGGIYLTGGLMDDHVDHGTIDTAAFKTYFIRPLVPVVVESLMATPVLYCHETNLPIQGLSYCLKGDK